MRVLFVPFPLPTHFLHQVSLAWALRSAGHDVRIAAGQPSVVDAVMRSGLTAVRVGGEYDLVAAIAAMVRGQQDKALHPDEFRVKHAENLDGYGRASAAIAGDLLDFAEWWRPDIVIGDPLMAVTPIVSETLRVPLVRQLFGIDQWRLQGFPGSGAEVEGDVRATWPGRLVEIFDRFGTEVRADYAACTVDPVPLSMEIPQLPTARNRVPIRYVPFNGPGVAPAWLTEKPERPRICLTWGTVATAFKGDKNFLLAGILEALAALDVEIVAALSASDRDLLGEPPKGVRVVSGLPLHLFLPTCDAIFHHGGGGASLTAAALGVPQVICPQSTDQGLNASQIAATGAGVSLLPEQPPGVEFTNWEFRAARPDPDEIKAAMQQALTEDPVRDAAARVRAEFDAQPSPAEAVGALEGLVV